MPIKIPDALPARETLLKEGVAVMQESEAARQEEESGSALVRTVRMVVWRRSGAEAIELLPIIPWEILDYVPYEVLDFPDEDR